MTTPATRVKNFFPSYAHDSWRTSCSSREITWAKPEICGDKFEPSGDAEAAVA